MTYVVKSNLKGRFKLTKTYEYAPETCFIKSVSSVTKKFPSCHGTSQCGNNLKTPFKCISLQSVFDIIVYSATKFNQPALI